MRLEKKSFDHKSADDKAFEFALGNAIANRASAFTDVVFERDEAYQICKNAFDSQPQTEQDRFTVSALLPMTTLFRLEPAIVCPKNLDDKLFIGFNSDAAGIAGDVRDVLLSRKNAKGVKVWEIGISAKNNHDAVKHSRLSPHIDFGDKWIGTKCSDEYMGKVASIFSVVDRWKEHGARTWNDVGDSKEKNIYVPLLDAFQKEMKRIFSLNPKDTAENLIMYLIGRQPFYKVIKQDRNAMVVMKVFNFSKGLGLPYNGKKPDCKPDVIPMPTRLVELDYSARGAQRNSLAMIMDKGWQVDFRIHNASTKLEDSLKFDIQLVGNPPVLFTQHVF